MARKPIRDPHYWRDLAETARANAQREDPESKMILLGIADGYERLAKLAERSRHQEQIMTLVI
jgi:hypothetical protein